MPMKLILFHRLMRKSFAPTDLKLVTGSDDGTARIWDFARCTEERVLRGHGSDVRSVDWHPQKGLIVTGSRDSQQPVKLWDPKSGQCLATIHDHKNSVMAVQWNKNGNWLLSGSRDHLIKMYDIRMMREMHTYRGHKKEVTAIAWHPIHESLFVSGGGDGSLAYWLVNSEKELGFLEHAHDQTVWTLEWHPLGHILASGSNDNNTKFWARNRPGDTQEDIFGLASFSSNPISQLEKELKAEGDEKPSNTSVIPGMGLDDDMYQQIQQNRESHPPSNATSSNSGHLGGPLLFPEDPNTRQQGANIGAKRTLIKQPPPKKAQRQFERMWNVAKPAGGDDYEEDTSVEENTFKRSKTSLLGPPPPSMLSSKTDSPRSFSPIPKVNPPPTSSGLERSQSGTITDVQNTTGTSQPWVPPPVRSQRALPQSPQHGIRPSGVTEEEPTQAPLRIPSFSNQPNNGPLLWPPPISSSSTNTDIDYRVAPPVLRTNDKPPQLSSGGDVDLRNQGSSSQLSQSWRPGPALLPDNRGGDSDEISASSSESVRIHDPRMRCSDVISHNKPQDLSEVGHVGGGQPMRDPRRRPPLQSHPLSRMYGEGAYPIPYDEPPVGSSRLWSSNASGSGGNEDSTFAMSPSRMNTDGPLMGGGHRYTGPYNDHDDRAQKSFAKYGGGGPMRRGGSNMDYMERGRGRGRGRRGAY
ncbi:hypothetical protein AB6A40_004787 [Gnathostoma spinigerum]|uniref:Uncharacterized protein n=1 Tax=Gnathostoma spinigerum TaxID=75299 RepID=A0ABD6EDQ1_9BILA